MSTTESSNYRSPPDGSSDPEDPGGGDEERLGSSDEYDTDMEDVVVDTTTMDDNAVEVDSEYTPPREYNLDLCYF